MLFFLCFFCVSFWFSPNQCTPSPPPFRAMQKCKVLLTLCLPRIWFNMVYARRPASVVSKSCPWWHRHKYRQHRRKSSRSTAASSGVTLRSTWTPTTLRTSWRPTRARDTNSTQDRMEINLQTLLSFLQTYFFFIIIYTKNISLCAKGDFMKEVLIVPGRSWVDW